jgi:DNA-binding MarR family transcriptional regulator
MTVKELIEFLLTSWQNLTAVFNRLERMEFIERLRIVDDGRIRRIRLTEQGAPTWNEMLINIRAYYRRALGGFSNEDCLILCGLLDRLKSRLATL